MARKKTATAKKESKSAAKKQKASKRTVAGSGVKRSAKKKTPAKSAATPKLAAKSKQSSIQAKTDMPLRVIRRGNVEMWLLGTAHVSAQSIEDVKTSFQRLKPDAVCVELCQSRFDAMRDPDRWRKLDISRLIRERKIWLLASSLILSAFQKKIGESTGSKPGAEMLAAVELTEAAGKAPVLADREIRTTLRRAWQRVGLFSKMWLVSYLFASLLVSEDIEAEEIERLKNEDVLTDLFSQLPARYDAVKQVIIDERDSYLAENIRRTADELADQGGRGKKKLLAVVGAGHLPGITRVLEAEESVDLDELDATPPARNWKTILSLLGMGVILSVVSIAIYWYGRDPLELGVAYVVSRSVGSGIGALLARAHILTTLVTIVVAPFAQIIAIFGPRLWMFSALTEVYKREPRVEDFENLSELDLDTFRGFINGIGQNRVLKLFVIIFMVSLGLTAGNGVFWTALFTGF